MNDFIQQLLDGTPEPANNWFDYIDGLWNEARGDMARKYPGLWLSLLPSVEFVTHNVKEGYTTLLVYDPRFYPLRLEINYNTDTCCLKCFTVDRFVDDLGDTDALREFFEASRRGR